MEEKSLRAKLIELIIEYVVHNAVFENVVEFQIKLQEELENNLKFMIKTFDIREINHKYFGKILFTVPNEEENRIIDFNIDRHETKF